MDIKDLKKLTQKMRVLYVEDEATVREETARFLNHFFDDIVIAHNGQAGLECFENEVFDLVITDLKMPKLSGEKMILKIKDQRPETIVIAISGISDNENRENLRSDFFINKPTDLQDFIDILTKIMEQQ